MTGETRRSLDAGQRVELLATLEARFDAHPDRHPAIQWADVVARLEAHPDALWTLHEMERTGGEPHVVGRDEDTGAVVFYDCAPESPEGRRSVCYDQEALESRKKHKPETSAVAMADAMGATLLDEGQYRRLQTLGEFDAKTSSWLRTPADVRELGGAIFGDYRFGRVFVYHNGAESYYAARGFRCALEV
jgi:hypothetical protein